MRLRPTALVLTTTAILSTTGAAAMHRKNRDRPPVEFLDFDGSSDYGRAAPIWYADRAGAAPAPIEWRFRVDAAAARFSKLTVVIRDDGEEDVLGAQEYNLSAEPTGLTTTVATVAPRPTPGFSSSSSSSAAAAGGGGILGGGGGGGVSTTTPSVTGAFPGGINVMEPVPALAGLSTATTTSAPVAGEDGESILGGELNVAVRRREIRNGDAGSQEEDEEEQAQLEIIQPPEDDPSGPWTVRVADRLPLLREPTPLLHLEVWLGDPSTTESRYASRRFAVVRNASVAANVAQSLAGREPFPPASIAPLPSPTGELDDPATGTASSTAKPAATTSSSSGGVGGSISPPGSSSEANDKSSGLSTGAIAGIAVGAGIVVLALAGAIIFLLCRRRRKNRSSSTAAAAKKPSNRRGGSRTPYGGSRSNATRELLAEKEAGHAGVRDSSLPPSFSDHELLPQQQNNRRSVHSSAAAVRNSAVMAGGGGGGREGSYTPYSDRPIVPAAAAEQQDEAAAAAAEAPRPRSSLVRSSPTPPPPAPPPTDSQAQARYAHLIEEGMTREEIARIEDEERQLDAAIAQAARRP